MSTLAVADDPIDDLIEWARLEYGAHVELDPWGQIVVTPATDPHIAAVNRMNARLVHAIALAGAALTVSVENLAWRVPGGSGYTNVPDLAVLANDTRRLDDGHLDPPPLLVVEVASSSTAVTDRTRKLDDYERGGAGAYWMVELPALVGVPAPRLTLLTRGEAGRWAQRRSDGLLDTIPVEGVLEVRHPVPLRLPLADLIAPPGSPA